MAFTAQRALIASPLLLLCPAFAAAYEVPQISTGTWDWTPGINIPLFAAAAVYSLGIFRLARSGASLRSHRLQMFCFIVGIASLVIALDSPIHELGERLFWVHMTQHEMLILISAPLLVLSRPLAIFLWAFREPARRAIGTFLQCRAFSWLSALLVSTPVAWSLHAGALWIWHYPPLFNATLSSDTVHAAQHISFFGTGLLFWWSLLFGHGTRLNYSASILYLFTTAIHTSVLGALLTFTARPWYSAYANTTAAWNLTPLQDQQLGGLIMWVPAGALLTGIALALIPKWLRQSDRRWQLSRTAEIVHWSRLDAVAPQAQNRKRQRPSSLGGAPALRAQGNGSHAKIAP